MSIKKRFEELKRIEQIQLYGIVLMCYILVFVFYEEIEDKLFPNTSQHIQKVVQKRVKTELKRLSNLEVYQHLNGTVKKYHIDLVETKISQNNMKIDIRGEFDDIISFMKQYEENFIIDSYEMKQILDNTIALSLSINIEKFYENKNMKKNDIKSINPYRIISPLKTKLINKKDENIIIRAILGSEVLIDEKWYTIDDIYDYFK
ncbi:MAG: hypothetical protein WA945_11255, partial [Arcobacteraceae bacterium]